MPRRKKRTDEILFKDRVPANGTRIGVRHHGRSTYQGPFIYRDGVLIGGLNVASTDYQIVGGEGKPPDSRLLSRSAVAWIPLP